MKLARKLGEVQPAKYNQLKQPVE